MFSVEGCAFGLHKVGVAVFALVSLVACGFVFSCFCDVFVFFFLVADTFWVLAYSVILASMSTSWHVVHKYCI